MPDVFTFGEAMLRLSVRPGDRLESAERFDVHVAGSEANVAWTLASLGRQAVWFSRLPDNPLGRRVVEALRAVCVDCSTVQMVEGARLGTYFVQLNHPPRAVTVEYDRAGSAAAGMSESDLPWDQVEAAAVVHVSGITPALSPSCRAVTDAVAARVRDSRAAFTLDINYRAKLWPPDEAGACLARLCGLSDLVLCSLEDARDIFGETCEPSDMASRLGRRFDVPRVVVTAGNRGAWWWEEGAEGYVPALEVEVIDRVGAGDAFAAGVIDGLLDGSLELGVRRGAALAAIALTTRGDQGRPSRNEIEGLLRRAPRAVDR